MKKVMLLSLLLCALFVVKAQDTSKGYHVHDGFYLSLCGGPVFGSITDDINGGASFNFSGTGGVFDFKIGGTIAKDLILHATLLSSSLPGPKISVSNQSVNAPNEVSIGESLLGAGLTYYFMPQNIFISGSAGIGGYTIIDTKNNNSTSTDNGFAMQIKVGKEWWVSKNWGLGVALSYNKTNVTNKDNLITEKLSSNRFGILFNATFN